MRALAVVGAGGHGKVIADAARDIGFWSEIAFFDDRFPDLKQVLNFRVIDKPSLLSKGSGSFTDVVAAIGNNAARVALLQRLQQRGFNAPCIVHPRAFVSSAAMLGPGTVILAQAAVNADVSVGCGGIVNTGATVDHDCRLGKGVHISPGAHLAGEVRVGDYAWIGIGASVRQRITIGRNAVVGAGSVVVKAVADNVEVVGVPAKPLGRMM